MPFLSYRQVAPRVNEMFKSLPGMVLARAEIVPEGLLFVYENAEERYFVRIYPKVYTQGKNIVDPINDLTLLLQVRRQPLSASGEENLVDVGSIELTHSTWLGEDFL